MQRSTARRDRLVSPLSLILMVGVFSLAFFLLRPALVPGTPTAGDDSVADLDELELAYLKARKHTGRVSDADVISVIERLTRIGRIDDAHTLLADYPQLDIGEPLRFEIDLAHSAAASTVTLYAALSSLRNSPQLHQADLLERGVNLSKRLEQPRLTAELYSLWADTAGNDAQSLSRYRACGLYLAGLQQRSLAVTCFEKALQFAEAPLDAFEVRLALLPLTQMHSLQQQVLVRDLMNTDNVAPSQRQELAEALLQIERPDVAYRVYAKLAVDQPDRAGTWLPLAARWSEAAGKPDEAAVFLDTLAADRDGDERRQLQQQVESLLLAAERVQEAYDHLQRRLRQSPDDIDALQRGVVLARQIGEVSQALDWNTRILSFRPADRQAVRLQRELALAVGNLPLALRWAERLVGQQPESRSDAVQVARISEWNGQPEVALDRWQRLSRSADQLPLRIEALREVARLAEMTLHYAVAASALREVTLLTRPTRDEVVRLTTLYEMDGRAERASVALQDLLVLYGADAFYLRTLATHEFHHSRYEHSLAAWDRYVDSIGHDTEATLARCELLWRLDRKDDAAAVVDRLQGRSLLSQASDYQLRLMGEIAWRYRKPWLSLLVQPRIESLEEQDQRTLYGRRTLAVLQESGKDRQALHEALQLWQVTGEPDFALMAMQLAVKVDDRQVQQRFSPHQNETATLQDKPAFWAKVAASNLRSRNPGAARKAFERALRLDNSHVESIAGLIWMAIGKGDELLLEASLDAYSELARSRPELWQAMAVGYLQLGSAASSLVWFDRLLDQIEVDYGMLLSYADALEYAGRSAAARRVRQYTLQQLRPVLISASNEQQMLLLRHYSRVSTRYADAESNEQLVDHLLKTRSSDVVDGVDDLWREDIAISWLMSTQQHEYARLIMAQIHEKRLQAPAWQLVALALKDNDEAALSSLVKAGAPLSIGHHILALRQMGNDRDAYALAQSAIQPGVSFAGSTLDDTLVAQEQYVSLRDARPSFIASSLDNRHTDGLSLSETGLRVRHTFAGQDLGLSLDITRRRLRSDQYELSDVEELSDVALSLFFGNARLGGRLTTGFMSAEDSDLTYGSIALSRRMRDQRSVVRGELAYNEAVNLSPELIIAGRQHRMTLGYEADIGRREFIRLQADATEINTRIEQIAVASGLGGSAELGVRGSIGSNNWSTSVRASHIQRERADNLPAELQLSDTSTMDNVLADEVQTLSLGASIARGGTDADFPQVSSPRYYLNASLGQNWPDRIVGFQIDAGAGIRVLGGDELSFSVSHDTQPGLRATSDSTSFGVNYRFHFQ